jgi:glycosyltransferase involved in cell wall biosynthesis
VSTVAAGHVKRTLPRVAEVSVVPNLVETSWWHEGDQHRGTPGDAIQLVLVGRLKKRKHVDEFFDALALARARLPLALKVSVTVVGEGPRRHDLQRQLDELGLADWVTLVGHRDAHGIRSLLHESDLFIASSRHESFGLAALEARAAGLPVLGYRGNGLSDFIEHGREGQLVADTAEMADALVALLGDRRTLEQLRNNTMSTRPSVCVADAMQAVEDLYRRARSMHGAGGLQTPC